MVRANATRLLGFAVALGCLSACGTTVGASGNPMDASQLGQQASGGQGVIPLPSSGTNGSIDDQLGRGLPSAAATGGSSSSGAIGAVGSTGADATSGSTGTNLGIGAPGTSGWGYTAKTVYIGVNTWQDVGKVGVMVAGQGMATGDQQAMAKAVIEDLNRRGGIAGRRVEPVFYDQQTAKFDPAVDSESACALWTQDRPVFAVVYTALLIDDQVATCLNKKSIPMIEISIAPINSALTKFPLYWATSSPTNERYFPAVVRRAKAQGYFNSWDTLNARPGTAPVKIGLQTGAGGVPGFTKLMTPLVEDAGYKIVAAAEVNGAGDGSGAQAAVLKFQQAGVTHVIQSSQCFGGTIPFHQAAESQQYRPRVLLQSGNCPELLQRFVPARQYAGAIGAGFAPAADVAVAQDPGDPSPARAKCRDVMRAAGQDPDYSRDAQAFMYLFCDGFSFVDLAVRNGGGLLQPGAFQRGAQLIRSLPPSSAFAISLASRRDGADAVRDLRFDAGCSCTKYFGANQGM